MLNKSQQAADLALNGQGAMPVPPQLTDALTTLGLPHRLHWKSLRHLYSLHHVQRFQWLRNKIAATAKQDLSILEIGCAEARSLDYIPMSVRRYLGFDAGWRSGWLEGKPYGIEAARDRYGLKQNFDFHQSVHYRDIEALNERFDVAIALETLEYLETSQLDFYIRALAQKLNQAGSLFSTMPNEMGIPLLVKALGARVSGVQRSQYTASEFMNALLRRMERVPRAERGRKGFDYRGVIDLMRRYFRFVRIEAIGFVKVPPSLSLNVGVIASHSSIDDATMRPPVDTVGDRF